MAVIPGIAIIWYHRAAACWLAHQHRHNPAAGKAAGLGYTCWLLLTAAAIVTIPTFIRLDITSTLFLALAVTSPIGLAVQEMESRRPTPQRSSSVIGTHPPPQYVRRPANRPPPAHPTLKRPLPKPLYPHGGGKKGVPVYKRRRPAGFVANGLPNRPGASGASLPDCRCP